MKLRAQISCKAGESLVVNITSGWIANPPAREQLKNLSVLMRGSDQSLVRKYDPLFRELSLDDRFIGDSEFWTAIFEHPTLINGPILVLGSLARVCRSELGHRPLRRSVDRCRHHFVAEWATLH